MDRVTRHPLLQDIPMETAIDYAVDFIRIVGMPDNFIEKTSTVKIVDYRGELPCDLYEILQVRLEHNNHKYYFRYSTDNFHFSKDKPKYTDLTYKTQGTCIFTSIEKGTIEISYRALPIDENGYPLIPDDSSFAKALELYIKKEWLGIQFDLGKINPQIMQRADQEYTWAVGQCRTSLIMPTIDQMQSISNMWNSLIDRTYHNEGFANEGRQKQLRIH